MKLRFEAKLEEAVQFEVTLPGDIKTYSANFLAIVNNAREYPREFYKVENNSGNEVYVTCPKSSADAVKHFLEWKGEITKERRVLVCKPEYIPTRETDMYLDKLYELPDDAPWDIVTLAPELE